MADLPIIFSAPMIRALLDDRKTSTRRVLREQPPQGARYSGVHFASDEPNTWFFNTPIGPFKLRERFAEGDRLWVREALWVDAARQTLAYRADDKAVAKGGFAWEAWLQSYGARTVSPIHMPRWASRLTLDVTSVKVERLQDISEDDAVAEGVTSFVESLDRAGSWEGLDPAQRFSLVRATYGSAVQAYRHLWETLHGTNAWSANPWVAAISFTAAEANIDSLPARAAA